jgi:hypothetical protein
VDQAHPLQAVQHETGEVLTYEVLPGDYHGVDLNRNYPTRSWGRETYVGPHKATSAHPDHASLVQIDGREPFYHYGSWCGPAPGSEPEIRALASLAADPAVRASITYHNRNEGEMLLYPDHQQDDPLVMDLGRGMHRLMAAHGHDYLFARGSDLYTATGTLPEYYCQQHPGRPSFYVELRPAGGRGFSALPEKEIGPCFQESLVAALALINGAGFDAPAGDRTLQLSASTEEQAVQGVRCCWEVFSGWRQPEAGSPVDPPGGDP